MYLATKKPYFAIKKKRAEIRYGSFSVDLEKRDIQISAHDNEKIRPIWYLRPEESSILYRLL
jgi:hypothetical protein